MKSMSYSTIFISNQTGSTFILYDLNNNMYGTVSGTQYSIKLPYSSTFNKGFKLVNTTTNTSVFFNLSKNGDVISVRDTSNVAKLMAFQEGNINITVDLLVFNGLILSPGSGTPY